MKKTLLTGVLAALLAIAGTAGYGFYLDAFPQVETGRLMELLRATPGSHAAEIGAGAGHMALAAARIIGPSGRLYATELGVGKIRALKENLNAAGVENVAVIEGTESHVNLPKSCCDAVYLSKVYHHFTHPAELNAGIFQSLRPGGRLAVIDFEPRWWRFWLSLPAGVPENRGGHGMPLELLKSELEGAGFVIDRVISGWWLLPERRFCVIARRPAGD